MRQSIICKFCNDNAEYCPHGCRAYPRHLALVYTCPECRAKYITNLNGNLISTSLFSEVNGKPYVVIHIEHGNKGALYIINSIKEDEPINGIYFSFSDKLIAEFDGFGGFRPDNFVRKTMTYLVFS